MNALIKKDLTAAIVRLTGNQPNDTESRLGADCGLTEEQLPQLLEAVCHRWGYRMQVRPGMLDMTVGQLAGALDGLARRCMDQLLRESIAGEDADEINGLDLLGDDLLLDDYNCMFLVEKLQKGLEWPFPEELAAQMPDMTVDAVVERLALCMEE